MQNLKFGDEVKIISTNQNGFIYYIDSLPNLQGPPTKVYYLQDKDGNKLESETSYETTGWYAEDLDYTDTQKQHMEYENELHSQQMQAINQPYHWL